MKNFFINYGRFFILAFVLGFLLPHVNGENLKADSTNYAAAYAAYSEINSLDDMIKQFHLNMNEITNTKIADLFASDYPNVLYPTSDDQCDANLSTYCVAYQLNENLLGFEQALMERKDSLEELENLKSTMRDSEEAEDSDSADTLSTAIKFANQQALVVEEQMQNAEDTLDLTLAVYNQIQIVWPLHVELQDFRKNLEGLRDNLAAVRDVIEGFPSKFNGASTAQCK